MKWETLKFGEWHSDTDVRGRTGDKGEKGRWWEWEMKQRIYGMQAREMQGHWWSEMTAALCSHNNSCYAMGGGSLERPRRGSSCISTFHHRVKELIAKEMTKTIRYHAARLKDSIKKQRGNLDTNCDAFKFPTSNTRDGSVLQADYTLPFHDNPCNALSR